MTELKKHRGRHKWEPDQGDNPTLKICTKCGKTLPIQADPPPTVEETLGGPR